MAVMLMFVNLALFFNNYVNPIALQNISWKYYILICCWLAVEFVFVYFVGYLGRVFCINRSEIYYRYSQQFFVETRYTPLEEIAVYFDDPVSQKIAQVAQHMEGIFLFIWFSRQNKGFIPRGYVPKSTQTQGDSSHKFPPLSAGALCACHRGPENPLQERKIKEEKKRKKKSRIRLETLAVAPRGRSSHFRRLLRLPRNPRIHSGGIRRLFINPVCQCPPDT
jgi:hypothetical protein